MRNLAIRPIEQTDNAKVAWLIRTTMTEMGIIGPGASQNDDQVNFMFEAYSGDDRAYFVVCDGDDNTIWGCGGISPLKGADVSVCELQKMYFRPEIRGQGFGRKLVRLCLHEAKKYGYTQCYLEAMKSFTNAIQLYESEGFQSLSNRLGNTGHIVDLFYAKEL